MNLVIALTKRSTKLFDKHPLFSIKQPLTWPFNVKSGEKIGKRRFLGFWVKSLSSINLIWYMCLHQARRKIKAVLNDFNAYLVLQNDDNWLSWKWQHMQRYISVIKAMRTLRIKWTKRKVMKISGQWWPRWIGFKLYVRYFKHATTICCLSSLNWSGTRSRGLDIGQVLCCTSIDQYYIWRGGEEGEYTGFQVTGMIKWGQKSQSKKNPWTKN